MASETHDRPETTDGPVLEVTGLRKVFEGRHGAQTIAVAGADFTLSAGECLAVVGESGSGKSTLARSVLRLIEPTAGSVVYRGTDLVGLDKRALRRTRRHLQMIFQDPYASLHPRRRSTGSSPSRGACTATSCPTGPATGSPSCSTRWGCPRRPSTRIRPSSPAVSARGSPSRRALGLKPDVLVLDEPVSALDVSIQAQVITLLMELQQELGLSYLFISHDLALVRLVATRVAVMYRGEFVEFGPTSEIFERPQAEYTRALLSASPALAEFGSGA